MELSQVRRGTRRVVEFLSPELGSPRQKQAHQRPIEDLTERTRHRGLRASKVTNFLRELLERVKSRWLDVGDERVAQPNEGLIRVVQTVVYDRRRTPHEGTTRPPSVARSVSTRGHGFA